MALIFFCLHIFSISAMAAVGPDKTPWPGLLRLARTTSRFEVSNKSSRSFRGAETASIAPSGGSWFPLASAMRRPRLIASSSSASSSIQPAAHKAVNSPKLCPQVASGLTSKLRKTLSIARLMAPIAGWAISVRLRVASCCLRFCFPEVVWGKIRSLRRPLSSNFLLALARICMARGKVQTTSRPIFRYWLP